MKRTFVLLVVATLAAVFAPLQAAPLVFITSMSPEVPANPSPGVLSALVTIDDEAHTMRVETTFSGLLSLTTVAHIHIGRPTGGVVTPVPTFPGFPAGVMAGTYDQLFDMTLPASYNPSFLNNATNMGDTATAEATLFAGILARNAYFNIHTELFPGGEIRGFLAPIPEPSTFVLAGGALAFLALRQRKRVRS